MSFAVQLDDFRGPIDLLMFLVRRNEVDITRLSLATITDQFLQYLDVLKEIQFDSIGDFVEVASQLVELKSRIVLPHGDEAVDGEYAIDPRVDLVERLLMYKEFRDAASLLEDQASSWQQRFARLQDDLPPRQLDLSTQPIRPVELWDLVSAFGRVLRDQRRLRPERILYDETPIQVYMRQIHSVLVAHGKIVFSELFQPGMHKSAMIGVFLALLELARHHNVRTEQIDLHGEILIVPDQGFTSELTIADVDQYEANKPKDAALDEES